MEKARFRSIVNRPSRACFRGLPKQDPSLWGFGTGHGPALPEERLADPTSSRQWALLEAALEKARRLNRPLVISRLPCAAQDPQAAAASDCLLGDPALLSALTIQVRTAETAPLPPSLKRGNELMEAGMFEKEKSSHPSSP